MGDFHIEERDDGISIITFDGALTDAQFDAYLSRMTRMLDRKTRYATILDASKAAMTPATQRKRQADWLRDREVDLRKYNAGTAFVITSALVRGALTAILWVQPMGAPHTIVSSLAEAIVWTRERLRSL